MKTKKWLPILLAVWPYLVLLLMVVLGKEENPFYGFILQLLIAATAVIYILNIINAFTYKAENEGQLAFWDMLIKLIHIPFYLIVFVVGAVFLLAMVVPALLFVSPFLVFMLAVIDFFLMLTSSSYGIHALIRAKQSGRVSVKFAVIHSILHLFFVMDVISAVIVFAKLKRT